MVFISSRIRLAALAVCALGLISCGPWVGLTAAQGPEIFAAINTNDFEQVRAIVAADKSALSQTSKGLLPLHFAINLRKTDMIKLLLELGADINGMAENGQTPLHFALARRNDGAAAQLIEAGADVNQPDSQRNHSADVRHDVPARFKNGETTCRSGSRFVNQEQHGICRLCKWLVVIGGPT